MKFIYISRIALQVLLRDSKEAFGFKLNAFIFFPHLIQCSFPWHPTSDTNITSVTIVRRLQYTTWWANIKNMQIFNLVHSPTVSCEVFYVSNKLPWMQFLHGQMKVLDYSNTVFHKYSAVGMNKIWRFWRPSMFL